MEFLLLIEKFCLQKRMRFKNRYGHWIQPFDQQCHQKNFKRKKKALQKAFEKSENGAEYKSYNNLSKSVKRKSKKKY